MKSLFFFFFYTDPHEKQSEVCRGVENEPMLQPLTGETLKYQTAKPEDSVRLDVSALGFWCRDQREFFDVRVFDPVAPVMHNKA